MTELSWAEPIGQQQVSPPHWLGYGLTAAVFLIVGATIGAVAHSTPTATVVADVGAGTPSRMAPPIGDGQWLVGGEIKPGVYRTTDAAQNVGWGTGCYADVRSQNGDTLAQELNDEGRTIIQVSASGYTFRSRHCGSWERVG